MSTLRILYSLDRTLFISSHNFVQLLFESSYYSRAAFINLGTDDEEIHCLKQGGVAADARESIRRDTAMLATVTDTEFEESDSGRADVEEDKDLFQGVLWLKCIRHSADRDFYKFWRCQ